MSVIVTEYTSFPENGSKEVADCAESKSESAVKMRRKMILFIQVNLCLRYIFLSAKVIGKTLSKLNVTAIGCISVG